MEIIIANQLYAETYGKGVWTNCHHYSVAVSSRDSTAMYRNCIEIAIKTYQLIAASFWLSDLDSNNEPHPYISIPFWWKKASTLSVGWMEAQENVSCERSHGNHHFYEAALSPGWLIPKRGIERWRKPRPAGYNVPNTVVHGFAISELNVRPACFLRKRIHISIFMGMLYSWDPTFFVMIPFFIYGLEHYTIINKI